MMNNGPEISKTALASPMKGRNSARAVSNKSNNDDCGDNSDDENIVEIRIIEASKLHDKGIDLCYVYHQYEKSVHALYRALHIRESILGKYHPDTGLSYFRIACILYQQQNNYHDALMMSRRELRISSHNFITRNNISGNKEKSDKHTKGNKKHDINKTTPIPLITSKSILKQSWLKERILWFKDVLKNVQELSTDEKGKYCRQLVQSIACEQMGDSYLVQQRYEKAMTHYNNALALECHAYGRNTLDIADLQIKSAECQVKLHEYDHAIDELINAEKKYRQQSYAIVIGNCHNTETIVESNDHVQLLIHSRVGEILCNIASIYMLQQKFDNALASYAKAYSVFEDNFGNNHPKCVDVLADLKFVTVKEMEKLRHDERIRSKALAAKDKKTTGIAPTKDSK